MAFGQAFGQKPVSAFGQTSPFGAGGFGASQATSGGFGGTPATGGFGQSMTQSSPFGQSGNNQTSGGLFGKPATGGGGFGQGTPAFGQQTGSTFGQTTGAFGTTGGTGSLFGGQNKTGSSPFGGATSSPGFGGNTAATPFGGNPNTSTGLFGSGNASSGGFGQASAPTSGFGQGQPQPGAQIPQRVTTIKQNYTPIEEAGKQGSKPDKFMSICKSPNFSRHSAEMLRTMDYMSEKGYPPDSYEYVAQQAYGQKQQQHLQKVQGADKNNGSLGGLTSGGGLFGAQSKSTFGATTGTSQGGGLFGTGSQTGGGLFGGGQSQQTSSFGNSTPQTGGGLFGAQTTPAFGAGNTGSGLFGGSTQANQAKPISAGLFGGSSTTPANPGTSLFGGTQQTGLFGQQAQPQTSLFGNPTQPQNQPTSLFGQQQKPATTGLFGGQQTSAFQPQPQQSSLFGAQQPQQQPSLFGQQPQQQPQQVIYQQQMTQPLIVPQVQTNQQFGIYMPSQPQHIPGLGPSSPFLQDLQAQENQLLKQKEAELAQTQVQCLERVKAFSTHTLNQEILAEQLLFEQRYAPPAAYQYNEPEGALDASEYHEREWRQTIAGWQHQQESQRATRLDRTAPRAGFQLTPSGLLERSVLKERSDKQSSKKSYGGARDAVPSEEEERRRDRNRGVCRVLIDVQYKQHEEVYQVKIHETLLALPLYEKVKNFLQDRFEYDEEKEGAFSIHYRNKALSPDETLKNQVDVNEDLKMWLVFESLHTSAAPASAKYAPTSMLPLIPDNLKTEPNFEQLKMLTEKELSSVRDFRIFNQFGSIQFVGETDLREVNLKEEVAIDEEGVDVYNDEKYDLNPRKGKKLKPPVGSKLNKEAVIVLHNQRMPEGCESETHANVVYASYLENDPNKPQHISYSAKERTWKFRVFHFTRYGPAKASQAKAAEPRFDSSKPQEQVKSGFEAKYKEERKEGPFYTTKRSTAAHPLKVGEPEQTVLTNGNVSLFNKMLAESKAPPSERFSNFSPGRISVIEDPPSAKRTKREMEVYPEQVTIRSEQGPQRASAHFQAEKGQQLRAKAEGKRKLLASLKHNKTTNEAQLKTIKKNLPAKKVFLGPKAAWLPNGSLLTYAHKSKDVLRIESFCVDSVKQEASQRTVQAILTNFEVTDNDSVARTEKLASDLKNLSVANQQKQIWAEKPLPIGASKSEMEESFWSDLYADWRLPSFRFKADARSLSGLFSELVSQTLGLRERLRGCLPILRQLDLQFYTYCLLNALYGNPNLQLHQSHPDFRGIVTLQECKKKYGASSADDGMEIIDRKRKNAVTELFRFICTRELQPCTAGDVTSLDDIYKRAYHMVINGNIDGASDFLSEKQKYKMAGFVAQCISNDTAQMRVRQFLEVSGKKFNPWALKIMKYIGSGLEDSEIKQLHWMQALLYFQNFELQNTIKAQEVVVQGFIESCKPEKDSFWLLLQTLILGTGNQESFKCVNEEWLRKEHFGGVTNFDAKLPWVVQLVIRERRRYFNEHPRLFPSRLLSATVPDADFGKACEAMILQQVIEGNPKEALAVVMLSPLSAANKKHQVNRLLQSMGPLLNRVSQEQTLTMSFLRKQLQVKEELIAASRALQYESNARFEKAISFWLEARNFEKAGLLFARKIAPLYFLKDSKCKEEQLLTALEGMKIEKDAASILAPILEFLQLKGTQLHDLTEQAHYIHIFTRIRALYQKVAAFPAKHIELQGIQRSILEQLLRMETSLKAQAYTAYPSLQLSLVPRPDAAVIELGVSSDSAGFSAANLQASLETLLQKSVLLRHPLSSGSAMEAE